jgi:cephamycin C biosynthesis protein
VHSDQTPISAHKRVTRHASDVPWNRFQLINVWRPLKNPVYDYPLAVADFRTIDVVNDLIPTTLVYPPPLPNGETYSIVYNPQHRWYYWSKMIPDEVLLLKCYDSASRALSTVKASAAQVDETLLKDVAGLTPHTAFYDGQGATEGPSRQSIEVRALVFYD